MGCFLLYFGACSVLPLDLTPKILFVQDKIGVLLKCGLPKFKERFRDYGLNFLLKGKTRFQ